MTDTFDVLSPAPPADLDRNGHEGNGATPDLRLGVSEPHSFPMTDYGNAERLVEAFGDDIRFCEERGKWLCWTGALWDGNDSGRIVRYAKRTVRRIYDEARHHPNEDLRAALAKHAAKSENGPRIREMIRLAESEDLTPVRQEQLDRDPYLFNCPNGTIDLRTGDLLPHRRDQYLTKCSPVPYSDAARCPTWESFLNRVMDGADAKISFIQRALGYCMTADTSEEAMLVSYGTGRNGKTLTQETASYILGDYAWQTRPETILARNRTDTANDLAALHGRRLVTTVETDEGSQLAEGLVKQLTGGDRVTARFLYQEWFTFTPTFKLWLATNHLPVIRGNDLAIWERIILIPFTVTIPREERDPYLRVRLRQEAPGILRWMVQGCLEWQRQRLNPPREVQAAVLTYRTQMDVMAQFLEDCCTQFDTAVAPASGLYHAYQSWCEENGERRPLSQKRFGTQLGERGFERSTDPKSRRTVWQGLGLRDEHSQ